MKITFNKAERIKRKLFRIRSWHRKFLFLPLIVTERDGLTSTWYWLRFIKIRYPKARLSALASGYSSDDQRFKNGDGTPDLDAFLRKAWGYGLRVTIETGPIEIEE